MFRPLFLFFLGGRGREGRGLAGEVANGVAGEGAYPDLAVTSCHVRLAMDLVALGC